MAMTPGELAAIFEGLAPAPAGVLGPMTSPGQGYMTLLDSGYIPPVKIGVAPNPYALATTIPALAAAGGGGLTAAGIGAAVTAGIGGLFDMLSPGWGVFQSQNQGQSLQGASFGPGGVPLGGPGLAEPPAGWVAKEWHIQLNSKSGSFQLQFYRLIDGRVMCYNQRTKGWKIWKPSKPMVISRNPKIKQLIAADKFTDNLVKKLGARVHYKTVKRRVAKG